MLALGISAIGKVGPAYYQNVKTLPEYYAALDAGALAVVRGIGSRPTTCCAARSSMRSPATSAFPPMAMASTSHATSRPSSASCASWRTTAWSKLAADEIVVTPKGRLLVRSICMVFDRYLREKRERATYSKVV